MRCDMVPLLLLMLAGEPAPPPAIPTIGRPYCREVWTLYREPSGQLHLYWGIVVPWQLRKLELEPISRVRGHDWWDAERSVREWLKKNRK